METHKDLQEFQNHHTNPKTTGSSSPTDTQRSGERSGEEDSCSVSFPSIITKCCRCFASPKEAIVGLGTVKEFEAEFSDIMDLNKHYLVENDAMEGGANEENVEIDEKTSQI
ncbi:uncharacterized protein LOC111023470 isoform X4 [Momordica charantia]|uniref:Uncharacterized protein LOC111023470 isoform X4 n=1 Tax=Momordica charantia TaxID=3673 RepID=A0A6J1DQS5_MOMCH|nr:uncharacterized protein LOC111023470 isoform X4 [Momordica charantia]